MPSSASFLRYIDSWEENRQYEKIMSEGKKILLEDDPSVIVKAFVFSRMAEAAVNLGRFDLAKILTDKVVFLVALEECSRSYIRALVVQSRCLLEENRPQEAMALNNKAKELQILDAWDRKLCADILFNEFWIRTNPNSKFEFDPALVKQLLDICNDYQMNFRKNQILIRAAHFLVKNRTDQMQLAGFYLCLIDHQTLAKHPDLLLQNKDVQTLLDKGSEQRVAQPVLNLYGKAALGIAVLTAAGAGLAYVRKAAKL